MSRTRSLVVPATLFCLCLSAASSATAQRYGDNRGSWDRERNESYYTERQGAYQPNTRAIVHQKAQIRAAQRDARLASMAWYGMSNSRPTASPTPFASLYSPVWQVPGGRPFAWYGASRSTYVFYTR